MGNMSHKFKKSFFCGVASAFVAFAVVLPLYGATELPPGFTMQAIGGGWMQPMGVAFDPSPAGVNRLYVWERGGRVWLVENGVKAPTPMLDIAEEAGWWGDFGLLGFALDPKFHENGYVYCLYVVDRHHLLNAGTPAYNPAANEYNAATIARITRFTARAEDGFRSVDPASRLVLVGESKGTGFPIMHLSHGPGSLAFAADGTLLASCGNGASFETLDDGGGVGHSYAPQGVADGILPPKEDVGSFRSQLVDSLSGKIIRIDPATGDGVPGNPFFDPANPRAARSRVWALGLRNPFRFTIRPESGAHLAEEANPGVIVVADVGENAWEEINVIDRPGQNFGWPLYEGLRGTLLYAQSPKVNLDAPNPLGGYFRFGNLIVQDTLATPSWPNPANPALQIPPTLPRFVHRRPVLEYGHNQTLPGPVRLPVFAGTTAAEVAIDAPGSPVAGSPFAGDCIIGGCFYTGTNFPESYWGAYFFADYQSGALKTVRFDANDRPVAVEGFGQFDFPVWLAVEPATGALFCVNLGTQNVAKIVYAPGGNLVPIAAASASVIAGPSPLEVTFSSAGSIDPEGLALAYRWDFGDGTSSTLPNPTRIFTTEGTRRFDVTLTVTDVAAGESIATVPVFVNHTLPDVTILSPVDGAKYPLVRETPYRLSRRVIESPGHPTSTRWEVFLHHNEHEHPDPPIDLPEPTVVIPPTYSAVETYSYRIQVTVTDDLGASVRREVEIYPNARNNPPAAVWSTNRKLFPELGATAILDPMATLTDADSPGFERGEMGVALAGAKSGDRLSIVPDAGGLPVGVSGATVRWNNVVVGTWGGGIGTQALGISFNDAATPAAAQAILRRVAGTFPLKGTRTARVWLTDGDGGSSALSSLTCDVFVPPKVCFARATYSVNEIAGAVVVSATRSGELSIPVWVKYATANGTATAGADYLPAAGTLHFAPGQTSAGISIPILQDTLSEATENFTIALDKASTDVVVGSPAVATISIVNNNTPAFQFNSADFAGNESDGVATIAVNRTGGTTQAVTVRYETVAGTAVPGVQYFATSGVLSFAPGETRKTFPIALIDDTTNRGISTVTLRLTTPTGGATLGAQSWSVLRVIDDENPAGIIQVANTVDWVSEHQAFTTIVAERTGGTAGAVSVAFKTVNGSAIADSDFTSTTGTLTFAAGQVFAAIQVPILNDAVDEPDEFFRVELSSPGGGASVGARSVATRFIISDDSAGGLLEIAGDISVNESAGAATLTIVRTGDSSRAVTVNFFTGDFTTTAGSDYIGGSGTVALLAGEASKTFLIPILNDSTPETVETFGVGLSTPTNGAVIGARSWAAVSITDDD